MLELIKRLEEYYDFECEGGKLKNCKDWMDLKESIDELLNKDKV